MPILHTKASAYIHFIEEEAGADSLETVYLATFFGEKIAAYCAAGVV